ncbi:hypothetical protein P0082_00055 [Candidatus Haliotispira prima]|uniref:Uncharacterized protein n=1 Tax=Candidatus Haliotispira prima TaxID=3034016 RepID=A0ABY8MGZ7_9SPIO|nr:hypothetical protein P0082_00055 [Candidatus Haliotispira prima]
MSVFGLSLLACAPISDSKDPEPNPDISFSVTAVASSVQLEVTGIPAITDVGAVIRPAAEAAPTKAEALASKGYVSLSIEANNTRKFSISQHYGSDFTDGGFTLADVLTPNTKYKLYLYMPTAIDLGQTVIKGGVIKGDTVEISFTTASLPPAGDAVWNEKFAVREYAASLNEYHFMENQTGVFVAYFWSPSIPPFMESSTRSDNKTGISMGGHAGSTATPDPRFYYNGGIIEGYVSAVSQYTYIISADKYTYTMGADEVASPTLRNVLEVSATLNDGSSIDYKTVITRY